MKINHKIVAEHLGVRLRGNETFDELLKIEQQVKEKRKVEPDLKEFKKASDWAERDAKWDEFDLKLYSAIHEATGVQLNEDAEIFELYCNLRDAIFNEYQ